MSKHTSPEWPFDQARDVAAVTDEYVLDLDAPILVVIHYSDDHSWAFLSGNPITTDQGKVIAMAEAVELDPSLYSIADLPPGWIASRARVGAKWARRADPEM